MEEATYLAGLCRSVTLVHRREDFRASKTMQARVLRHPKIRVIRNAVVEEVLDVSKGEVTGARLRSTKKRETMVVPCSGFFVDIGHTPNTDCYLFVDGAEALYAVWSTAGVEGRFRPPADTTYGKRVRVRRSRRESDLRRLLGKKVTAIRPVTCHNSREAAGRRGEARNR